VTESINAEFEAYVKAELGDIAVVSEGRFISPKIQNYFKIWQHLKVEVVTLRKDAARYQWLRSRVPGGAYRVMGIIYSEGGEGVDAGIDSAIAGEAT
jgi:hypothetical protein